jgi:hypothetical protein
MFLHIELPDNLRVQGMLGQRNIPCLCRIGGGKGFELAFQHPLSETTGRMEGADRDLIDERAPAAGGGEYTHYCFATVTLERTDRHCYRVIDLSFFYEFYPGWFPIVKDGQWSDPVPRHTPEELAEIEEMETAFRARKLSKKQRKLVDALSRAETHTPGSD